MMLRYLARRLFLLSFVLIALTVFSFSLNFMFPGDFLTNITGLRDISNEQRNELSQIYGINQSYFSQYIDYVRRIFSGDWDFHWQANNP